MAFALEARPNGKFEKEFLSISLSHRLIKTFTPQPQPRFSLDLDLDLTPYLQHIPRRMTAALQHRSTGSLWVTDHLTGKGITPFVVHGRPVAIAEPPTIDVIAEAHPVEVPPGRRPG